MKSVLPPKSQILELPHIEKKPYKKERQFLTPQNIPPFR
jgi:hypothetical protein